MKREDFIFTIGYSGMSAMVDKGGKKRFGRLSADELLEKGLYRSAFASVIYDNDKDKIEQFVGTFRSKTTIDVQSVDQLKRLFGVYRVPEGIKKVVLV